MTNSDSPSTQWTKQHGTKKIYTDPVTASIQAARLTLDKDSGDNWMAYPCCWGPDYKTGHNAQEHWHVGRSGRKTS